VEQLMTDGTTQPVNVTGAGRGEMQTQPKGAPPPADDDDENRY